MADIRETQLNKTDIERILTKDTSVVELADSFIARVKRRINPESLIPDPLLLRCGGHVIEDDHLISVMRERISTRSIHFDIPECIVMIDRMRELEKQLHEAQNPTIDLVHDAITTSQLKDQTQEVRLSLTLIRMVSSQNAGIW